MLWDHPHFFQMHQSKLQSIVLAKLCNYIWHKSQLCMYKVSNLNEQPSIESSYKKHRLYVLLLLSSSSSYILTYRTYNSNSLSQNSIKSAPLNEPPNTLKLIQVHLHKKKSHKHTSSWRLFQTINHLTS